MKPIIQDISEITDSRELLESKPYPFITIFIYLVMAILMGALAWSYFSEIDIVVKANGMVRPNEKISTITNQVSGKVEEVHFENGQRVNKGELLYTISHDDLKLHENSLIKNLHKKEVELNNLKKFKDSILDGKNYFNLSLKREEDYYYKYLKYSLDLEKLKESTALIITQIRNTKEEIDNLNILLSSISCNENLFKDTSNEYSIKYQDYVIKVAELTNVVDRAKENYDTQLALKESGAVSEKAFKEFKNSYDSSLLSLEKYKNEALLNYRSGLDSNKKHLEELEIQLRKAVPNMKSLDESISNPDDIILDFRTENLISINNSINVIEAEIDDLNKNIEAARLDIENCIIRAPISGHLNVVLDINNGDNILSGSKIATLVPSNDSEYKVQIYVPNKDISNVSLGDSIKYHFYALPYKEYGELEGKITKIGVDSSLSDTQGSSVYLVEADIENRTLYSHKGEKAEIKIGMGCEAQVVTKTKNLLFYLLEKIDLRD